ncbi:phage regulatory protein, partial [Campylobacter jejuni]|nr:phage regulatory protein [Campylobacter jejuni]
MSNKVIINKQEVQFDTQNNQIFCTSLDVAKVFGKEHKNILRDIKNILNDLREIGDVQCKSNFELSFKVRKIQGFKGRERKYPYYNLTRDGFSLLAMGFTGKKALQFKIAFINAFNEMEKLLQKEIKSPNKYLTDL